MQELAVIAFLESTMKCTWDESDALFDQWVSSAMKFEVFLDLKI